VYDTSRSSPWVPVICVIACIAIGAMLAMGVRP
jgi:hypothetical protein